MELLVVCSIIAILSAIILSSLWSARARGRDSRRIADIKALQLALSLYRDQHPNSYYPPALTAAYLVTKGFISAIPLDPQNQVPYSYSASSPPGAPASTACVSYHLGASLEVAGSSALATDADVPAAPNPCTGSNADFNANDNDASPCKPTDAGSYCFDVTP